MPIGAFTGSFDLPLLLVIVFFLFFLGLVYYLQQEMKREGYPLVAPSRKGGRVQVVGFPAMPKPKIFYRPHGLSPKMVPDPADRDPAPNAPFAGNPLGGPIDDGVAVLGRNLGPGSWVERDDVPDRSHDGRIVFRPMRHATEFVVMKGEADPRGYAVLGCDKAVAGTVVDIWIDDSEHYAKFLEVELTGPLRDARPREEGDRTTATLAGEGPDDRLAPAGTVLLPIEFASVDASRREVRTGAITAAQFAAVPGRRRDVVLTAREENRLRGYYGGGYLWAVQGRTGPLL